MTDANLGLLLAGLVILAGVLWAAIIRCLNKPQSKPFTVRIEQAIETGTMVKGCFIAYQR